MTNLRTAAQQALGALEQSETTVPYEGFGMARREAERKHQAAITALRAALAQQAEPAKTFLITGNEFCGAPPAPYATWGDALAGMFDAGKIEGLRISALAQQAYTDDLNQRIKLYVGSRCGPPQQAEPVAFDWPRKACPCRDVQNGECLKLGCKWERDPSLVPEALRRQAGMQQAEPVQEPVAWIQPDHLQKARIAPFLCRVEPTQRCADFVPLYLVPPQRKPLTDEEIIDAVREADLDWTRGWTLDETQSNRFVTLARAIERAHGIGETK